MNNTTRLNSLYNLKSFMAEIAKTIPDLDWSVKLDDVQKDIDNEKKKQVELNNGKTI